MNEWVTCAEHGKRYPDWVGCARCRVESVRAAGEAVALADSKLTRWVREDRLTPVVGRRSMRSGSHPGEGHRFA